jgi:hypothetical protein
MHARIKKRESPPHGAYIECPSGGSNESARVMFNPRLCQSAVMAGAGGLTGWMDVRQAPERETMRISSPHDLIDTRACRHIIPIPAAITDPDHARPLAVGENPACWSGGDDPRYARPNRSRQAHRYGARRGVRQDLADRPRHVVAEAVTELCGVRKTGVVSGLHEAGHQPDPRSSSASWPAWMRSIAECPPKDSEFRAGSYHLGPVEEGRRTPTNSNIEGQP